ncbi:hypothetical protein [Streptomyces avicenniae]|uniref:hypothetical protein n=1 Tax=Streptomyces avicenniae TaxID=500153 RepID=UPI000699D12B|nr:hypothetical protein [Streptomyces avicenniae]
MLTRTVDSGAPFGLVIAHEFSGQTSRFLMWWEELDISHVLAVPKSQMVMTVELLGEARAYAPISRSPEDAWTRLSCDDGARGRREHYRTVAAIRPWRRENRRHRPHT